MADLVLNVSETMVVEDSAPFSIDLPVSDSLDLVDGIGNNIGFNPTDIAVIADNIVTVIPSYLDRLYIGEVEHFITVLSVE